MRMIRTFAMAVAMTLAAGPASALAGGLATSPSEPFFPSDDELAEIVRPYLDGQQAKGIVIGMVEPDGRRRVLAFGEAGQGARPLSADSVFEIGSITKTFTGAVLADMVRRGQVRLDDPVERHLPHGVRVPSFNGRPVTLVDLATHTSGLPRLPTGYVPPDPGDPWASFAPADLYAFLARYELPREPGAKFEYSNLGMGLLGHALARAAGEDSFQALVSERVLRPLDMRMTAYGRPPALSAWMTRGHDPKGVEAPYFDVAVLAGGGGLNSNAVDLMKYLDANLGEPESPLEHAMRDAQRGHYSPRDGVDVGLGWMRMTRGPLTLLGINGNTAGYSTYLAINPDVGAGVLVLVNSGGFEYADAIGRALLDPERNRRVKTASVADGTGEHTR